MKSIRLSTHAEGYLAKRGFSREEVIETIRTAPWLVTEGGGQRRECAKEFRFERQWNGKYYRIKKLRPIFVEEATEIVGMRNENRL
jgi:hypothetical protein